MSSSLAANEQMCTHIHQLSLSLRLSARQQIIELLVLEAAVLRALVCRSPSNLQVRRNNYYGRQFASSPLI
jgi:hypothetical protein